MPTIRFVRFLLAISAFGLVASVARAQVPDPVAASQVPIPGVGHHYIGIGAETVNPADGSLSFDLPLQPPPGRGLSFPFGIHYNASERFSPSGTGPGVLWVQFPAPPFQLNGWNYQLPVYTASVYKAVYGIDPLQNTLYCDYTHNYVFRGFDGIQRSLGVNANWPEGSTQYNCTANSNSTFVDGFVSGLTSNPGGGIHPPFLVIDPSGTNYRFPSVGLPASETDTPWGLMAQTITDRNGNQITFTGASNSGTSGSYKDTVGRTVVSWSGIGSSSGDQLSIAGFGGNVVVQWTNVTESFPESGHDVADNGVASPCTMTPNQTSPKQIAAVSEIDVPGVPTQSYSFIYDPSSPYGRPTKIVFPGHGYVRYVWGLYTSSATSKEQWPVGQATAVCTLLHDTAAITDRFVSYDGSTEVLHQQFVYSPTTWDAANPANWLTKRTTVTSTDLVTGQATVTTYNYVPGAAIGNGQVPVEQQVVYQDGSGKTLKTVNKTWVDISHPVGEQTILDNGQGNATLRCYNGSWQVSDIYEYGFQAEGAKPADPSCAFTPGGLSAGLNTSAIGPLKRHKSITYAPMGATNIINRPCDVNVYIPSQGATLAETQYFYDGSTTLCGSPAPHATTPVSNLMASTHDEINYAPNSTVPRGNVTRVSKLCIPSCGRPASTYTYDETGQVLTATDPCGNGTCNDMTATSHTTSYTYDDNYDSPPTGNTNAYLKTITYPPTNGVSHVETFKYAYSDGQLILATDQNLRQTQYLYNDPLRRLKEIDYPDGGTTTILYNDATYNPSPSNPSPSITTTKAINVTSLVSVSAMDGLGHVVQTKLSAPNCPNQGNIINTTYNGMGNVRTVSNPYCTTSDGTNGITTYDYDALGRTKQVTYPDGNSVLTSYTGRAAQVQDEGNGTQRVTRISQIDGLHRLVSVCEVASGPFVGTGGTSTSSLIGSGGTPASCGLDIPGTGFLTSYQYDALDDLLQVTQPGVALRKFTYDSLNHLMSATNPESGATCYGTVAAGVCTAKYDFNGNLSTKTDARGITTTFGYDALNRLLTKVYSDGTPGVTNTYDAATVDGLTLSYPVGRLVKTATNDVKTATVNSYDPMGRVKNQWQCTPQNCGTGYFSLPYGYDLLGDITSAGNGMGVTIGYGFDGAAELLNVTSTLSDASHPATLFSNPTYTPFGAISSVQLGNGVNETRSYNTRLWLQSLSAKNPTGGTATAGSGSVTITGSEQSLPPSPTPGSITVYPTGNSDATYTQYPCGVSTCPVYGVYDTGTVSLTVNGFASFVGYGQSTTQSDITNGLANGFNSNPNSPVTANAARDGGSLYLQSKVNGAGSNYPISTSSTSNASHCLSACPTPAFGVYLPSNTLTGGGTSPWIYDTGVVQIIISGWPAQYSYGQNDTYVSVASGLASALSASPYVNATANNGIITIVAKTTGSSTNYRIGLAVQHTSSYFATYSFTPSSSTGVYLTGGSDNTIYNLALGSYAPDGNVLTANDSVNGNWIFNYDAFNRVVGANQNSGQSVYNYVYDRVGNRWQQNGPHTMVLAFSGNTTTNNNRADGYSYDLAGNLLNDGSTTYTYDAESRISTANNGGSGLSSYLYDSNGRRVRKTVAGASVDFLYDLAGNEITEVSSAGVWNRGEVYAGSRHLATYNNGTTYFNHSDWLGTERARSSVSGVIYETCTSLVFGDWLTCSGSDPSPMHFTGKEHDSESGLDYFGARYTVPTWGRFMSPDSQILSIKHIVNPQKWNRYAYTINNPLGYVDPDGLDEHSLVGKIADAIHVQGSVGVGLGATIKVSGINVRLEASMKSQGTLSFARNVTTSVVKEAGASAELFKAIEVGYKRGSETVTVKDGVPVDNFKKESTDVIGFSTGSKSSSVDKNNVEVIGAGICVLGCVGVSVGIDKEKAGVAASAIGAAIADIKCTRPQIDVTALVFVHYLIHWFSPEL